MVLIHKVETESRYDREVRQWHSFEELLRRAERDGLGTFNTKDAEALFSLQRLLTIQLVQSRTQKGDQQRTLYLDSLVKRGNSLLHPESRNLLTEFRELLLGGFSKSFRGTLKLQWLALLLFFVGAYVGFELTLMETEYAHPLVGLMYSNEFIQLLIDSPGERTNFLRAGREHGVGSHSIFFTALFINNFRAAVAAFCLGFFCGIPTILILLINGALLGSFAAIFHESPINFEFWAWVLPHGIPEVLAVCVAAAGGLRLGMAVISPGAYSRRFALSIAGRDSARLLGLTALLLLYAAFIEAFIRQSTLSELFRYTLALVNFVSLVLYLSFAGLAGARFDEASQTPVALAVDTAQLQQIE